MRAKWRKIIWAILAVQLLLVHLMILQSWQLKYYLNRATAHFGWSRWSYINWNKLAIGVWIGSSCVVMLLYYLHYLWFRRKCILKVTPVSEPWILECIQKAMEETRLQKRYPVHFLYYNEDIKEPFVIGFRKPILLLPTMKYEREVLPLIFLHECYHIRHRDTLYKLFMIFLQSLMWFQPFMYLLKAVSFLDVEVACDEAVVEGKDMETRKAYSMALLRNLEKKRTAGEAYSAYFYHRGYQIRARVKAIMDERRRWDCLAVVSIFLLLTEVLYSGYQIGHRWYISYQTRQEEQKAAIYEGYEIPESFTQAAAERMLAVAPAAEDTYYKDVQTVDDHEMLDYADLPCEAEGPWQIRLEDADRYQDAIRPLLVRYLYYYIDQKQATDWDLERDISYLMTLETVYQRLLAGGRENAVWAVVCKKYVGNEEELLDFPEPLADRAQFVCEQGAYYAYFDWTVQVRMVQDYVFELEGVADTGQMLAAYMDKYPQADYADVPFLDLVYLVDRTEIGNTAQSTQSAYTGEPWKFVVDTKADILQVSGADGIMREVPVPLSEMLKRGDEMNGKLTSLQAGSYQVDENKIIFAYGGSGDIPFSVVFYEEESDSFKKSIVTYDYFGGRMIFVDFPENGQEGFLIATGERVMYREDTVLFHTADGGKSWQRVGPAGPDVMTESHSLTTGAGFISNEVGFVTIRDSQTPDIWRTGDGGVTWEKLEIPDVQNYYGMAYMPEEKDGVLTLYVGMEEYSEYGGTKAKYVSDDEGITWEYRGLVLRK
ncbi:MAG: hypothetical protein J1E64_00690 [Acetatifactor sp.]|nr:hypothetical protein [Acetatifactor sp.]